MGSCRASSLLRTSEPALPRTVAVHNSSVEGVGGSAGSEGPERLFEAGLLEERTDARGEGLHIPLSNR
eukprot:8245658-Alexandrium_andersonii.AAC.1